MILRPIKKFPLKNSSSLICFPCNSVTVQISDRDVQVVVHHPVEDEVGEAVPGLGGPEEAEVGDDGSEAGHYREDGYELDGADLSEEVGPRPP